MTSWAPLFGSALVAFATLVVLRFTLRSNTAMVEAAREREIEQAHRTAVIASAAEAVGAATELAREISLSLTNEVLGTDFVKQLMMLNAQVQVQAARLRIVSTPAIADDCRSLALNCQVAIAQLLLNWHKARADPPVLIPNYDPADPKTSEPNDFAKQIWEWSNKIDSEADALATKVATSVGNPHYR